MYGVRERRVMAFLEGHTSYVSCIAFDPFWSSFALDEKGGAAGDGEGDGEEDGEPEPRYYRVVSGGQDAKLCFWDLHIEDEPLDHQVTRANLATAFGEKLDVGGARAAGGEVVVPSPKRLLTPRVAPAMCHVLHPEPIVKVIVDEREIFSVDQGSRVRVWLRPMRC